MSDPTMRVLHELTAAVMRGYWNEASLDEKPGTGDPVKFRLGSWDGTGYLGAISGDRLEGDPNDPTRREKVLIAFKLDPDPVVELYLMRTADSTEDGDMVRVIRATPTYVEVLGQRIGVSGTIPHFMDSPDGRWRTQQQDDGNFVTYDFSVNPPKAVWSAWTGRIP